MASVAVGEHSGRRSGLGFIGEVVDVDNCERHDCRYICVRVYKRERKKERKKKFNVEIKKAGDLGPSFYIWFFRCFYFGYTNILAVSLGEGEREEGGLQLLLLAVCVSIRNVLLR